MIETAQQIAALDIASQHLRKFRAWLDLQVTRIAEGEHRIVPEAREWANADSPARLSLIRSITAEVDGTEGASVGQVIRRIFEDCQNVFEGHTDPVELLVRDDGLTNLYKFYQEMWDCKDFFSLLGHAKPTLKVLEIGAGTGGTTAGVLEDLKSPEGVRTYSRYSFTDISSGFFVAAKERFKDYQGIDFAVLDISKDPIDQGFESESYDLIIASNVHAVF
jgi:SAM-dependent methyltransferase